MSRSVQTKRPPLIFQHPNPALTLESLWSGPTKLTEQTVSRQSIKDQTSLLLKQAQTETNINTYVFVQYVQYLYLKIFVTQQTTQVYHNVLVDILTSIRTIWTENRITDTELNRFLYQWVRDTTVQPGGRVFVNTLQALQHRINPESSYPGMNDLLSVIKAIYDDRPCINNDITLYRATLCEVTGYDLPTLTLVSTYRVVSLNTTSYVTMKDLYWKFVYSLDISAHIKGCGDLTFYFYLLASLALPMNPISLVTNMRWNLYDESKTGVPFPNYLAMYFRQREFGLSYTLSRLADSRRRLSHQLHKFCGVGATTIQNGSVYLKLLLDQIEENHKYEPNCFLDDELVILETLRRLISSDKVTFTKGLRFEESLEALKSKSSVKKTDKPEETDETKESPPQEDDDGAFADDKDPATDTTIDPETDPSQSSDDNNIGQSNNPDSVSVSSSSSKILHLALPTETIEDHLYRLAVLRFVSSLSSAPDQKISPEVFSLLKMWCGSLLFIVSASVTKSLFSQIKLTGKLKEFVK